MSHSPRIAAYLGIKDEAEIIERSIAHLRAIGVDYIMVCDMSSTDGTAVILEKYRSDTFSILTLTNDAISLRVEEEDTWFSHSLRRYKNAPADWVLFLDADEFWLPASGKSQGLQSARNLRYPFGRALQCGPGAGWATDPGRNKPLQLRSGALVCRTNFQSPSAIAKERGVAMDFGSGRAENHGPAFKGRGIDLPVSMP